MGRPLLAFRRLSTQNVVRDEPAMCKPQGGPRWSPRGTEQVSMALTEAAALGLHSGPWVGLGSYSFLPTQSLCTIRAQMAPA